MRFDVGTRILSQYRMDCRMAASIGCTACSIARPSPVFGARMPPRIVVSSPRPPRHVPRFAVHARGARRSSARLSARIPEVGQLVLRAGVLEKVVLRARDLDP